MRRVLLTGATGRIGGSFFEEIREKYWFRLASRSVAKMTDVEPHETFPLDVADLDACQEACRDIDTVLHLAANPSPQAGFYEALLDQNLKGAYNIFQAALDQGCRRVVYASSIQLARGLPAGHAGLRRHADQGRQHVRRVQGLCRVGRALLLQGARSVLPVRARGQLHGQLRLHGGRRTRRLSAWISERDMNQLFMRAIEADDGLMYAILHGVSDNRFKRLDIRKTRPLGRLCAAGQLVRLLQHGHRQRRTLVHGGGRPHAGGVGRM